MDTKNKTTYKRSMHDKQHPYTQISADLINNNNLTGEERFLLIYLLGRSDDYILHSSYFANKSRELFGWGRDKFYSVWRNLQTKGFIEKEKIRDEGKIDGHHYIVHESLLKNQNPENPESRKSGIRKTTTLPSIDEPIIDKPNVEELNTPDPSTNTNLVAALKGAPEGISPFLSEIIEIKAVYKLICELNPEEISADWRMTDGDYNLIKKAIKELGYERTILTVAERTSIVDKPYYSVAYIFSDFKKGEDSDELTDDNIEVNAVFLFDDIDVWETLQECQDKQEVYEYIRSQVAEVHSEANYWTPSSEDLEYSEQILYADANINVAQKLRDGLKSAYRNNEWRFGQIVYQVIAAVETKIMTYG